MRSISRPTPESGQPRTPRRSVDFRWKWGVALQVALAVPYLLAVCITPPGLRFGGLIYNPDDPYVYLSWMRQAFDGHYVFRNLFTLEAQTGASFHVLFLLLGVVARLTGVSLVAVYQIARGLLGIGLVAVMAAVIAQLEPEERRRNRVLVVASLGSGSGWTWFLAGSPLLSKADLYHVSTDVWMTETVPFLSILLNPLFAAALLLLLASFFCMLTAETRASLGWAVAGGVCLLILGNVHSYDILVFHPVWAAYLVILTVMARRVGAPWPGWRPGSAWLRYVLAAVVGAPSVLYQAWVFRSDAAFHARAMVATLSPAPLYYFAGIGLLLPLACLAAWKKRGSPWVWWLCTWAVLGLGLPYVPLPFQRKLAIGMDLPYLLLAGMEVASWADFASRRRQWCGVLAATALIGLLFATNGCFLASDVQLLARNQSNVFPPLYIPAADWKGIEWLAAHAGREDAVLSLPPVGNIIPAVTGRRVYVGHWGETARFDEKWQQARDFFRGAMPANTASAFLRSNRIRYVYEGSAETSLATEGGDPDLTQEVPGLVRVYAAGSDVAIYRVTPDAGPPLAVGINRGE
ncbi:MAG: hypothetical protein LC772_01400 [Chloroflexi bacterium]|nr:hypothetical protein [Chloroflexota bacterium]